MNCAEFETELAKLLGAEIAEKGRLDALARHAAGCESCGGSADLIELLRWPAAERELVDSPPDGYWDDFNRRVLERSRRPVRRSRPRWQGIAAAAALVILALFGLRALRLQGSDETGEPVARHVADNVPDAAEDSLDETLDLDGPPLTSGRADGSAAGGWLFPETDALDDETAGKLLDWLRSQNAAAEVS